MAMKSGDTIIAQDITDAIQSKILEQLGNSFGQVVLEKWVNTKINSFLSDVSDNKPIAIADVYKVLWESMHQACRLSVFEEVVYKDTSWKNWWYTPDKISRNVSVINDAEIPNIDPNEYQDELTSNISIPSKGDIISPQPLYDILNILKTINDKHIIKSTQAGGYNSCHLNCYSSCHSNCHGSSRGRR